MIISNDNELKRYLSQGWGNIDYTISCKDVLALLQGKEIGLENFGDEYTVTLRMEELV